MTLAFLILPGQFTPLIPSAEAASPNIVISQIYGGGGSTSTSPVPSYKNDYIELFNRGNSSVTVTGWSVQYASATGSSWAVTALSGSIAPGQYYLVQQGTAAGATGATLPAANASGTISMAAGAGKVALVNSTTALTGAGSGPSLPTPSAGVSIIDYVGYGGSTSSYEGAGPTGTNLNTTTAAFRASGGCKDDDSNSADFANATPSARNTSSPTNVCGGTTAPSITTHPQDQTITAGHTATLTVVASGTAPLSYQWYQGTKPDTSAPVGANSASFTTPALNNTTNYWVRVSNSAGSADSNTATVTVNAVNPGALQFASGTYTVAENGGSATINVTRAGGSDGAVSVDYATSDGSGVGGTDYTPASGTLSFGHGETSKTFSVPVIDDAVLEGNKTVNVAIGNPTGGAILGSPTAAVLTITENETVPPGAVVISQIYGGGGNAGAVYQNDFIEIFNRSTQAVDLSGWSVQYSSAAGSSWGNRTNLTGTLAPGQYFLISGDSSGSNGVALPAADIVGGINMSGSTGKVALVSSTTALTGTCPTGGTTVIDFVGYGASANCYEGPAPAPTLDAGTAALRARNGCKDTDYNGINFTEVAPTPRNSSSPTNLCPAGDEAPEVFSTVPASGDTNIALASNVTINFDQLVTVSGTWFELSCDTSGAHTATVTGGGASFTLNPDTDFVGNELCTVKVIATQVADQDANDPPDTMAADYTYSFRTLIVRDPAEHMVMGNPSGAVTDEATPLNYLMMKPQFALSYNNDRGIPNWTSWHLDSSWTTNVSDRTNAFRPDDTLPASFKHVQSGYNFGTYGFDRGHMVPSADRTSSEEDNRATFLMTNMVPQASGNNQGPWNNMEQDIRSLLNGSNNEIYVVSGGHGVGGNSTTGYWESIQDTGGNTVVVPNLTWKVVMVMPRADGDDVARVNDETRTFAVIMPNNDNIRPDDWRKYLATVDQVEVLTGYNFFSNVPDAIENVIEARLDGALDTAPTADGQTVSTPEDTQKVITLSASDFNVNNVLTYTVVQAPQHGVLSEVEGNQLTYTPDGNYNGPDAFTFKANDGGKDSNTATVSINVTPVNDAPTLSGVPTSATINELTEYTFTAAAEDVDNATLTFSLMGEPAGAAINSTTGAFTWTPTEAQGGTGVPYSFTVRVTDGTSNVDAVVTLTVEEVNSAPTLAAIGDKTVALGSTLTFTAAGADADLPAQTLAYSLTGTVPAGASINSSTGAFSWTPTAAQAGQVYTFGVSVSDGGLSDEEVISVGVAYTMTSVLQPVRADGSSVFKAGQTIPVKFQLTGASAGVTDAVIRLLVAKVSDNIVGTEEAAGSTSNATVGNLFRYSDGQYIFNLSTAGLTPGTYQLRIDAGGGVPHTVLVSLK